MAILTKTLWTASDPTNPQNVADLQISYDDVLLRITRVAAHNPTSKTMTYSVTSLSNGRNYNGSVPPNTAEAAFNINNNNAQNRLNITITANGRLDGVEYSLGLG